MGNNAAFFLSIFWLVYGLGGIFGFCIPAKYKGYSWSKKYSKDEGISWIMVAIPWLIINLLIKFSWIEASKKVFWIMIAVAVPGVVYSFVIDKKYKTLLEKENAENLK